MLKLFLTSSLLFLSLHAFSAVKEKNIVMIVIDDLRPELPLYGKDYIKSPNINELAKDSVVFQNAYANVPVCGASRASLMTGIRPSKGRFEYYYSRVDEDVPNAKTLFGYLKDQGFHTESLGKIMHHADDSEKQWSLPPWHPENESVEARRTGFRDYQLPENVKKFKRDKKGPPYESAEVDDNAYYDGKIAERAVERLDILKNNKSPFFMAVGFVKPHLPFNAPKRYWDMYKEEEIKTTDNPIFPANVPKQAWHSWGELRAYSGIPESPQNIDNKMAKKLIHGYAASVSYTDAQVGKILKKLEDTELAKNTVVVLLGDHGWSLGEHSLWAKHSTFDVATRTPLLVKDPTINTQGQAAGLVEFVDVFPTLLDLLKIPKPQQLQGKSFVKQLHDPSTKGKPEVFVRWRNAEVIKTPKYALTQWFNKDGQVKAQMLFDHNSDRSERTNLADDAKYAKVINSLHEKIVENMNRR